MDTSLAELSSKSTMAEKRVARRFRRMWFAAIAFFVITLLFSIWWMGPAPPRHRILIATGKPDGEFLQRHWQGLSAALPPSLACAS